MSDFFRENPPWITLELTNKCNLNCTMCHVREKDYLESGNMDYEMAKKFVNDIKNENFQTGGIRLFWLGESTLHPKFNEILTLFCDKELREKKLIPTIGFDTNSHGLTDDKIEKIFELSRIIPTHIIISTDAATKKTYEKIRCGGDFHKVKNSVGKILEKRMKLNMLYPKISLQFIIMEENSEELGDFLNNFGELFKKNGIGTKILLNSSFASSDGFNLRPMTWQESGVNRQKFFDELYVKTLEKNSISLDGLKI